MRGGTLVVFWLLLAALLLGSSLCLGSASTLEDTPHDHQHPTSRYCSQTLQCDPPPIQHDQPLAEHMQSTDHVVKPSIDSRVAPRPPPPPNHPSPHLHSLRSPPHAHIPLPPLHQSNPPPSPHQSHPTPPPLPHLESWWLPPFTHNPPPALHQDSPPLPPKGPRPLLYMQSTDHVVQLPKDSRVVPRSPPPPHHPPSHLNSLLSPPHVYIPLPPLHHPERRWLPPFLHNPPPTPHEDSHPRPPKGPRPLLYMQSTDRVAQLPKDSRVVPRSPPPPHHPPSHPNSLLSPPHAYIPLPPLHQSHAPLPPLPHLERRWLPPFLHNPPPAPHEDSPPLPPKGPRHLLAPPSYKYQLQHEEHSPPPPHRHPPPQQQTILRGANPSPPLQQKLPPPLSALHL